jgi:pyruvate,water dikinase
LADGSRWTGTFSAGLSGLAAKTLGRSFQELLDTIGAYYYFPLAIAKSGEVGDTTLTLKVKPLRGSIDQAGGLVFALKDVGNYFVLRVNALEDNAILFEYINDNRIKRAQHDLSIAKGEWHRLAATVSGNKVSCRVGEALVFEYLADRPLHGHWGLWSKADSVTLFSIERD